MGTESRRVICIMLLLCETHREAKKSKYAILVMAATLLAAITMIIVQLSDLPFPNSPWKQHSWQTEPWQKESWQTEPWQTELGQLHPWGNTENPWGDGPAPGAPASVTRL